MQTHRDDDAGRFMERLEARAKKVRAAAGSEITGGKAGEEPLRQWQSQGIHVRQLPDDEQGILRISIGGGEDTPVTLNYLVFRGDRRACIALLKKALAALEFGAKD